MKSLQHAQTVLRCELDLWFRKQTIEPSAKFYLYYLPSTPEHNSGLLIAKNKPANSDYKLARTMHISGFKTIQQNINELSETLRVLPILDA